MAKRAKRRVEAVQSEWQRTHPTWHLPVDDPRHTEVLGCHVSTKAGKYNWDQLDWSHWWIDCASEGHLFSHANCMYFHVTCRADSDHDGCVFRVRCWYAGGTYKGWPVESIGIAFKNGKLHWIVRGSKEPPIATLPPRLLKAAKERAK